MTETILVNLTPEQQAQINTYMTNEQYPAGYRYVKDIVDANIQMIHAQNALSEQNTLNNQNTLSNLNILSNWLGNATSINANDGSFKSEFVRGYTVTYGALTGKVITEKKFQDVSNTLAHSVLGRIAKGGIPEAEPILKYDRQSATGKEGFAFSEESGWTGTLGDILPISLGGLGQDFAQVNCEKSAMNCIANWASTLGAHAGGGARAAGMALASGLKNIYDSVADVLGNT